MESQQTQPKALKVITHSLIIHFSGPRAERAVENNTNHENVELNVKTIIRRKCFRDGARKKCV